MSGSPFGFLRVKVIGLSVENLERANRFYGQTLGLPHAHEGDELCYLPFNRTVFRLALDGWNRSRLYSGD